MKSVVRTSEAFKVQVVRELGEGVHPSCHAARHAYGIRGSETVRLWVCRCGKEHLLKKVMRVESPAERSELRHLQAQIRELQSALSDAHLDLRLDRTFKTPAQARAAFEQAVWLHNNRRPHLALGYGSPAQVHDRAA